MGVAQNEFWRFPLFIPPRQKTLENSLSIEVHRFRPQKKLGRQLFASRLILEGNQNIPAEAFHRAVGDCAKTVGVSPFRFEVTHQFFVDPGVLHFGNCSLIASRSLSCRARCLR